MSYRIALLALLVSLPTVRGGAADTYEVYAVRFGTFPDFGVAGLVAGADRARRMDIPVMVWVVKGAGRVVLVDAGFYRERFVQQWKVREFLVGGTLLGAVAWYGPPTNGSLTPSPPAIEP